MTALNEQQYSPTPSVMLGLPRCVTLVMLACAVGALALWSRTNWLGLGAVVMFYYAHSDLGKLESIMTSGTGGSLNVAQPGLQMFGWSLLLGWGLLISASLLVLKHNHEVKQDAKHKAIAAGEPAPLGALEHLVAFAGGKVARGLEAAQAERKKEAQAAAATGSH